MKHCKNCGKSISKSKTYCNENCKLEIKNRKKLDAKIKSKKSKSLAVVAWRQRVKLKAIEYKGGCCKLCSYKKCLRALTFHHIDPSTKEFGIGTGNCRSWEKTKKELDKCILLCSNCHMELHDGLVSL